MKIQINKEYSFLILLFLIFCNVTYASSQVYLSTSKEEVDGSKYMYEGTVYQMDAIPNLISDQALQSLERIYGLELEQVYDLNHSNPNLPVKIITIQKYDRRLGKKTTQGTELAKKVAVKKGVFPMDKHVESGTVGYLDINIPKPYEVLVETLQIKGFTQVPRSFSYRVQLKASDTPYTVDKLTEIKQKCGCEILVKEEHKEGDGYPFKCQINEFYPSLKAAKDAIIQLKQAGFEGAFPVKYSLQEVRQ